MTNLDITGMDKMKASLSLKLWKKAQVILLIFQENILHPSPQESDWSGRDWTGGHTKTQKQTGETNLLSDWDLPKPQTNPNSKLEVDKINMDKLNIEHDNSQQEQIQVTDSLILPPTMEEEEKATTEEKWMLRQDTNKKKKNMNYNRRSMWTSSVKRRVILVQNVQATAISVKRNIYGM